MQEKYIKLEYEMAKCCVKSSDIRELYLVRTLPMTGGDVKKELKILQQKIDKTVREINSLLEQFVEIKENLREVQDIQMENYKEGMKMNHQLSLHELSSGCSDFIRWSQDNAIRSYESDFPSRMDDWHNEVSTKVYSFLEHILSHLDIQELLRDKRESSIPLISSELGLQSMTSVAEQQSPRDIKMININSIMNFEVEDILNSDVSSLKINDKFKFQRNSSGYYIPSKNRNVSPSQNAYYVNSNQTRTPNNVVTSNFTNINSIRTDLQYFFKDSPKKLISSSNDQTILIENNKSINKFNNHSMGLPHLSFLNNNSTKEDQQDQSHLLTPLTIQTDRAKHNIFQIISQCNISHNELEKKVEFYFKRVVFKENIKHFHSKQYNCNFLYLINYLQKQKISQHYTESQSSFDNIDQQQIEEQSENEQKVVKYSISDLERIEQKLKKKKAQLRDENIRIFNEAEQENLFGKSLENYKQGDLKNEIQSPIKVSNSHHQKIINNAINEEYLTKLTKDQRLTEQYFNTKRIQSKEDISQLQEHNSGIKNDLQYRSLKKTQNIYQAGEIESPRELFTSNQKKYPFLKIEMSKREIQLKSKIKIQNSTQYNYKTSKLSDNSNTPLDVNEYSQTKQSPTRLQKNWLRNSGASSGRNLVDYSPNINQCYQKYSFESSPSNQTNSNNSQNQIGRLARSLKKIENTNTFDSNKNRKLKPNILSIHQHYQTDTSHANQLNYQLSQTNQQQNNEQKKYQIGAPHKHDTEELCSDEETYGENSVLPPLLSSTAQTVKQTPQMNKTNNSTHNSQLYPISRNIIESSLLSAPLFPNLQTPIDSKVIQELKKQNKQHQEHVKQMLLYKPNQQL